MKDQYISEGTRDVGSDIKASILKGDPIGAFVSLQTQPTPFHPAMEDQGSTYRMSEGTRDVDSDAKGSILKGDSIGAFVLRLRRFINVRLSDTPFFMKGKNRMNREHDDWIP